MGVRRKRLAAETENSFYYKVLSIKPVSIPKEELERMYYIELLSQRDIASRLNVGQTTIRRYMNKYGMVARPEKEAKSTCVFKEKLASLASRYSDEYTINRFNTCKNCGVQFGVTSKTRNRKYCSRECLYDHYQKAKEKRSKQYCEYCGNEIDVSANNRNYKRKYCKDCVSSRVWVHEDKIDTECAYCKTPMKVIKSRYDSSDNCYCSVECMASDYKIRFSGEASPTWRGGKSHHYSGNFFSARKQVRSRDGYVCRRCGISEAEYGRELSVHHIRSYRDFENKQDANQLDNLVSLCEPCHRFVHSRKNTNKEFIQ